MSAVKLRSPNYPNSSLGEALDDIKKLYQKEGRGAFPMEVAAKGLGYKGISGPVRTKFASLRQYGFVEKKGKDSFVLSESALTLILRNQASKEYTKALRKAALEPSLFQELYETMSTSSDDALQHNLVVNRKFTDEGAKRFIEVFRETITLANLSEYDKMSRQEEGNDVFEEEEDKMPPPPPPGQAGTLVRVIPLPLSATRWVNLQGSFPVTEEEWKLMISVLEANKPGLVASHENMPPQESTQETED